MAFAPLPVNYTDAVWSGLKRYNTINNEDGTVSFQDVTAYSNRDSSFFGAKDANRMNEALNTIMSMVENGTDLYTAFQTYFSTQKEVFESAANETQSGFNTYVENLKSESDKTIDNIEADYRSKMDAFENYQEGLFTAWFDSIKGQLSEDAAGNLQNQINNNLTRVATVILEAQNWVNVGDYYILSGVSVPGLKANDRIDLHPDVYVLPLLSDAGVTALYAENNNGEVTFYCMGGVPTVDIGVQVSLTSVQSTP